MTQAAVNPALRFTRNHPCPICSGHRDMPQGRGVRCYGMLSSDGEYAHCTNDGARGQLALHVGSAGETNAYAHRLHGSCRCGVQHGPERGSNVTPLRPRSHPAIDKPAREKATPWSEQATWTEYDYTDDFGTLLYQCVRFEEPGKEKNFRQRRPANDGTWILNLDGVKRVPYRLPELLAGINAGDPIYVCEGEKDADAMHAAGHVATCNSEGASNFKPELVADFRDADVTIVQDKDDAGRKHAAKVRAMLEPVAKSIRIVEAKAGKDAADHLAAGHGVDDFVQVWPDAGPDRHRQPAEWKRSVLRAALEKCRKWHWPTHDEAIAEPDLPPWHSGLHGADEAKLRERRASPGPGLMPFFSGVVLIAGPASAAKTYLALASTIEAAIAGWDVLYVSSELGGKQIFKRADRYMRWTTKGMDSQPPERWQFTRAGSGSLGELIDQVGPRLSERRTIIVFDSISSFVDNDDKSNGADVHSIKDLRRIMMWCMNVKEMSGGDISFIVLSETNAQGRAKGRFGDYKADISITMESDDADKRVKKLDVVKWNNGPTGELGSFALDWENATLSRT